MYLAQKNMQTESELEKALETLYVKPYQVEFIEMKSARNCSTPKPPRRPKPSPSSAVGAPIGGETEIPDGTSPYFSMNCVCELCLRARKSDRGNG